MKKKKKTERKSALNILSKDWCWRRNTSIFATWCEELTCWKSQKDWGQEEKGVTEDEMVGWHHWLNGHEFEQTTGDGEGRGSLAPGMQSRGSQGQTWLSGWTIAVLQTQGTTFCHNHASWKDGSELQMRMQPQSIPWFQPGEMLSD